MPSFTNQILKIAADIYNIPNQWDKLNIKSVFLLTVNIIRITCESNHDCQ